MLYGQRPTRGRVLARAAGLAACIVALVAGQVRPAAAAVPPEVEAAVAKNLGIYSAVPPRRDADETITLDRGRLEIRFLDTLSGARREPGLCNGLRWLLVGRLAGGGGARAVFDALLDVDEVALIFYAVETHVEPGRDGRYVQQRAVVPQARFTIRRETAARLDPAVLSKTLVGARCVSLGRGLVDELWLPNARPGQ